MRSHLFALYSAALFLFGMSADAAEGFFRPDQLGPAQGLAEVAQGAAVLFDGRGSDGRWIPIANGFFISRDGHLLTNYHVGTNCGGRNPPDDYRDTSRPKEFPAGRGFVCRDFRARVFPGTWREAILKLELTARPDQATLDRGGDFIILRSLNYRPLQFISIARTREFPVGTPYFMLGYPPVTWRGESSALIRRGVYSDIRTRGEFRVAYGMTTPKPADYLHRDNPVPYFVGDSDGVAGTSGSLVITRTGNFLGLVQGYADPRGAPGNPYCLRDGKPTGMDGFYCPALMNYLRAPWILDRMDEFFPSTVAAILRASSEKYRDQRRDVKKRK